MPCATTPHRPLDGSELYADAKRAALGLSRLCAAVGETIEDAAQGAVVQVIAAGAPESRDARMAALYTLIRCRLIDRLRTLTAWRFVYIDREDAEFDVPSPDDDPEADAMAMQAVAEQLRVLELAKKRPTLRRIVRGEKQAAIAKRLGLSDATISRRVAAEIEAVRAELRR